MEKKREKQKYQNGKVPGAERDSPVVPQVGEDEVEQAGDEGHSLLLLIAAINHIQQGGQHLPEGQHSPGNTQLQKGKACPASGWGSVLWNSPQRVCTAV